ncbi:MAG: hypothetical protein MJE77_23290 [Proteobacteria bacterium]|nr:hypothetical protein [Pseudomonadota bacterium]
MAEPPVDSDSDGIADFRDLDSDDNGITDADEGTGDIDKDGRGDFADVDNDGDDLNDKLEIVGYGEPPGTPENPADRDGDKIPDFNDIDSDGDLILDADERAFDPDQDGQPSYLDLDSDNDCLSDSKEAGDTVLETEPADTDNDTRYDFHDTDSDGDGLSDTAEDPNCNGLLDPGETSATSDDTDGDGATDLIEVGAGTNARDRSDNPQANGDFVFLVPYQKAPEPSADDLNFQPDLKDVDVYVLVDRSGSMEKEIESIVGNIQEAADNITCTAPNTPPGCLPDLDLRWGAGTIGYIPSNGEPFTHHVSMQPNASLISSELATTEPVGRNPALEPTLLALWSVATGLDEQAAMCAGAVSSYDPSPGCPGGGAGYPCFRPDALPIVLLATDEPPITSTFSSGTYDLCPDRYPNRSSADEVCDEANKIGAKIIGIKGNPPAEADKLDDDLRYLANCTGAVREDGTALVEDGADAKASAAIEEAIKALAQVPLDLSARAADDNPNDTIDPSVAFVSHFETQQLGTSACPAGYTELDSDDDDSLPDYYGDVLPGKPVCWRLVPKQNQTVEPGDEPQVFTAHIEVVGDRVTVLDTRKVFFLVPPAIPDVIVK